ncbi:MAG: hypothetical protein KDN20_14020 [Verrucomicrobiae bacterium]|nr:hypothetical protein [Verrucomicrobiae bacterium]
MSSRLSPVHLLLILLAGAFAVSGWFYGWHWKRVATGAEPTQEEALIIQLQDQLDLMRAENDRLTGQLRETPSQSEPVVLPEPDLPE